MQRNKLDQIKEGQRRINGSRKLKMKALSVLINDLRNRNSLLTIGNCNYLLEDLEMSETYIQQTIAAAEAALDHLTLLPEQLN